MLKALFSWNSCNKSKKLTDLYFDLPCFSSKSGQEGWVQNFGTFLMLDACKKLKCFWDSDHNPSGSGLKKKEFGTMISLVLSSKGEVGTWPCWAGGKIWDWDHGPVGAVPPEDTMKSLRNWKYIVKQKELAPKIWIARAAFKADPGWFRSGPNCFRSGLVSG